MGTGRVLSAPFFVVTLHERVTGAIVTRESRHLLKRSVTRWPGLPPVAKSTEPHKKWWQRAFASSTTLTPGPIDYWQLPSVADEAAALFKMVQAGMSIDEVFDLIEVGATDRLGLDELAEEFPLVADKILQMVEFRKDVAAVVTESDRSVTIVLLPSEY